MGRCLSHYYLNSPTSKKNPVAMMAVTATAKPGHRCHSFITFTHDFFVILGSLTSDPGYKMRRTRASNSARLNTTINARV